MQVPSADMTAPASTSGPRDEPEPTAQRSARSEALLDLPGSPPRSQSPARAEAVPDEPVDSGTADEGETVTEGPAGFVGTLTYPASSSGLVQIGALALCLWLVGVFGGLIGRLARAYGILLMVLCYVIVVGYIVFYIGYCIYDSSRGGRRAPTIALAHTPDLSDLLSQLLLLVAGAAVCLWPAAVYRGVMGRADLWFWVLAAAGGFLLPMSLLTASLFDGIDALNPLLILRSIVVTLPAYLVLIVSLGLLGGVFLALRLALTRVPLPGVVSTAVYLYLLLIGAHLLGRFYWRRKDRLGWGL